MDIVIFLPPFPYLIKTRDTNLYATYLALVHGSIGNWSECASMKRKPIKSSSKTSKCICLELDLHIFPLWGYLLMFNLPLEGGLQMLNGSINKQINWYTSNLLTGIPTF